ncbi:MAG: glycoside hydrolase family 15 protein [Desulfobacterales bacterium]|nr:glycoside hydrolase family 15 protein [Desulfobacterales bacterium]MBF0398663.1 glycoside hydrolase family 15 protein [Desulfobacterales bacterium]
MNEIHKYNLGIIGNCAYIAYIDDLANVKWLCMPRFDSSFIFGSLIDDQIGGEFSISPKSENFASKQYYIENTNILCTEFTASDGRFKVIDFAPRFYQFDRYFKPLMLVRKIVLLEGRPFIKVKCLPVGDYGKIKPEILLGSNHIRYLNIGSQIRLTANIPLNAILDNNYFALTEDKHLVFTYGVPLEASLENTADDFFRKTKEYWMNWVKSTSIPNFYQKEIIRSALILKLHQYEDTGGIIAAGTTSLPEYNQSTRNWDYRYCWMRDAYYTLNAFSSIGHFEELEKYFQYIENIILNETDRIQPLYTITGEKKIIEQTLNLKGYLGNKPVRIGNDAYTHIQNDVYGEVLVSLLPIYIDKRLKVEEKYKSKEIIKWLLERIALTINEPDAGLWEFRNKKQFHCYTYLFHWAGSKAAIKIADSLNDIDLKNMALSLMEQSLQKIEMCYSPSKKAYTQAIGVENIDASCLQLISMNYINPNSQRAKDHLETLEKELKTSQGLFYRYRHEDDFGKPESTFLVCAFWYVEALACVGRIDDAIKTLENILKYSNQLGIFSEDVDIYGGQWGNFPQTYSHVGLMNAAFRIAKKLDLPIFY